MAQGLKTLSLEPNDKNGLYASYMPFVEGGGVFIPTSVKYEMGDDVLVFFSLKDEISKSAIAAKVIWITPEGAEGYRKAGVGVQFSDQDGGQLRNQIENYLAGALGSDRATHTM